jgi:hypothetical protein
MSVQSFFTKNDGSLPEIEVDFDRPASVVAAFNLMYDMGAIDVTAGDSQVLVKATDQSRAYAGPSDAALTVAGEIEGFHVVLRGVTALDCAIPDLGVLVLPNSLTLDYRMGQEWGRAEISSLAELLRRFRKLGATVSAPWWGVEGDAKFQAEMSCA